MIEPSFGRMLMTTACVALLLEARATATIKAAIALPAVAARADEEEAAAMFGAAKPLTEGCFRRCSHREPPALWVGQQAPMMAT
jgi:hypothetical protein